MGKRRFQPSVILLPLVAKDQKMAANRRSGRNPCFFFLSFFLYFFLCFCFFFCFCFRAQWLSTGYPLAIHWLSTG